MGVFTHISEEELSFFLNDYNLKNVESFIGINEGIQNTNYKTIGFKSKLYFLFDYRNHVFDSEIIWLIRCSVVAAIKYFVLNKQQTTQISTQPLSQVH